MNWWNNLNLIQQIFAVAAIPATLILIIQTVLLLLGMGGEDSGDIDGGPVDSDSAFPDTASDGDTDTVLSEGADAGLRIFTVRGLVAFFAVGGWVGIALIDQGVSSLLASLLALMAGALALLFVGWLFKALMRLQSSGNLNIQNAVGLTGRVYLRIPGANQGTGKVTLMVQERTVEVDAFTDQAEEIPTGQLVTVIARQGSQLLVRPPENR